jgi:hypothetical protein
LLKALRYGARKTRVTRSTTGLQLLSSVGLNNHDNRGTIEELPTATNTTEEAMHTESRRFPGNAYRTVSVHTATNIQSTVTAKNAITLLLKEVISIRFDQNLPQGEN